MAVIKVAPKEIAYDIHVPKTNNISDKSMNIIRLIKPFITMQLILGINRLYLLNCAVILSWICYCYTFILFVLTMYYMFIGDTFGKTYNVVKDTSYVEYLIIILVSTFSYRKTLKDFFQDLATFDENLNISQYTPRTIQMYRSGIWMSASIIYSVSEFIILFVYLYDYKLEASFLLIYITTLAHDSEQIFFNTMIRTIMIRVRIIKAHIAKTFHVEKDTKNPKELDKVEALSNNIQLDTTEMHRAYELLHKCAEQLNSIMGFPMIVMLFTSGLSTTMLLKIFFHLTQDNEVHDTKIFKATIVYTMFRCIKYTILIVIPCYYASVTTRQVAVIRTMLHNAINSFQHDKIERRKIKAFFQLTHDNEFAYALWGVIHLSMSLPLSYASLCTTYLVITIQFSKFID